VQAVAERRVLGAGWSSRLLQGVLLEMLADPGTVETVRTARDTYAARRRALVGALAGHGVATSGDDGINLWMEVGDEHGALVSLAARGIGAAPGDPFCVDDLATDHLRVTVSLLRADVDDVASQLAEAALAPRTWRRRR
jgi:DNA-binding transcriptional MocR family regulator